MLSRLFSTQSALLGEKGTAEIDSYKNIPELPEEVKYKLPVFFPQVSQDVLTRVVVTLVTQVNLVTLVTQVTLVTWATRVTRVTWVTRVS